VFTVLASLRKNNERWLYGLASVGLVLDLIFSKSRSGVLGLGIAVVWFVILTALWVRAHQQSSKKTLKQIWHDMAKTFRVSGVVIATSILCIALFGTPYTPSLLNVLGNSKTPTVQVTQPVNRLDEGGTSSTEIRKIVWSGAVDVWKRYPLLGSGVETFAYSYYKDRPMAHNLVSEWDFLYNKAHNEFLNFLATTGIVGLASYVLLLIAFIGYPAYMAVRRGLESFETSAVLFGLSAGLLALTVSNALGFSTVMVCVLLFLFPGMAWKLNNTQPDAPVTHLTSGKKTQSSASDELSLMEKLWPAVIGLVVLLGLMWVWRSWRADYLMAKGKSLNQAQEYSDGLEALEQAYQLGGNEGIFAEELGETYSWLSAAFADVNQATPAALYRTAALQKADEITRNNPYNVNFFKTKTRILATLAAQDPSLLSETEATLIKASELAPSDPKVRYNLGLIRYNQGNVDAAFADVQQAVEMKPNYEEARMTLARFYEELKQPEKALEQYRYVLDKIQPANTLAQSGVASIEAQLATRSATPKTTPKR
jgi:cytochrome c-type biogenesis protein CcmH/NrfG